MEKISVNLSNCFGIQMLREDFDFSDSNVIAIYARNGLMKTSFSKTFKKLQTNKLSEIKDEIFNLDGNVSIKWNDRDIKPDDIFVINSFENSYESDNIASLLLNDTVKEKINTVLKLKNNFIKLLEKYSGLKISKISAGTRIFELEPAIVNDFNFTEDSFLFNIKSLNSMTLEYDCKDVKYINIFDETVLKKITSDDFQNKINDFLNKSDEIYSTYEFLEKGNFTLPKLKDIEKALDKDRFFVKSNYLLLEGGNEIKDGNDLKNKITEIENNLKAVPEFKEIEKMLSDAKGTILKDIIENNPDLISYLKAEKLSDLRKNLWISYIQAEHLKFKELLSEYETLETEIESVNLDDTPWKNALNIFEERFTVPYKMVISNLKGSIIGESVPRVEFSFERDGNCVHMERSKLEDINVLSQGEKRALYLLNIIFDIEQIRETQKETLFIIDDIADSFDYKNKYAIVEYLYEMAQNNNFHLIILSHNFDFYRTVSSRLNIKGDNRLCADLDENKIVLNKEKYQNQPFIYWKKHLNKTNILALIPFVRNIIEYGNDKNVGGVDGINKDYLLLTHLLHEKDRSSYIKFHTLKLIYNSYLGTSNFEDDVDDTDNVLVELYKVADAITTANVDLEYKIILSIAIRHIAEKFMMPLICEYDGTLIWKKGKNQITGTSAEFMVYLAEVGNQTRELFGAYKQFGNTDKIKILEEVNIMTPENIHLNSFMYEPILDMDIVELITLYQKIKNF
jgi:hypothetical protein